MRISDWSSDVCSSDLSMAYDIALTDKLSVFVDDMRRLNVRCLPPCVNRSGPDFTVEQDAEGLAVRYALAAPTGVGETAMRDLVAARERGGPFTSHHDFAGRIETPQLNTRPLESLSGAGALHCSPPAPAPAHN